jgi:hypothetical protein
MQKYKLKKSRTLKPMKKLGLKDLPLLKLALADQNVRVVRRAVDSEWSYEGVIRGTVSAFNPFHRAIYISEKSAISKWFRAGMKSDRLYNEGDRLVNEVLFFVHDYLHIWAGMVIQDAMPKLKFGTEKITQENIEKHVFCHLLTEAVATVGLDYWYLSTFDINKRFDLGTEVRNLAVSYREETLPEYQKFAKEFSVQDKDMYPFIAHFYCSGVIEGFSKSDISRSPKLNTWLEHELRYGKTQREYTRAWFAHLSDEKIEFNLKDLGAPVGSSKPWQKQLIKYVGEKLWELVKDNRQYTFGKRIRALNPKKLGYQKKQLDLRFVNYLYVNEEEVLSIADQPHFDRNFNFLFRQFISSYEFKSFPKELLPLLNYINEKRDVESLLALFKKVKPKKLKVNHLREPRDLFFPN